MIAWEACPFCGEYQLYSANLFNPARYVIECFACKAVGPAGESRTQARDLWDNRPRQPEPRYLTKTCHGRMDNGNLAYHVLGSQRRCPDCVVACVKDEERKAEEARRKVRPPLLCRAGSWLGRAVGYQAARVRGVRR